ncbi:MAG: hypothetical protein DRP78_01070 [Candidatus Omnitrophota bacterium]|nr:MAG: hypothetical protein DRP78_01070 [Candidatus Omnitrophota bacterium]
MSDKLEKLTKQIYDEGVDKAKQEAEKIIASAQDEKKKILRLARKEAEDIISVANQNASDLKNRIESELRMTAQQSIALLRQNITELICVKAAESSTEKFMDNPEFLGRVMEAAMKEWATSGCRGGQDFYLNLPERMRDDLQNYFFGKVRQQLSERVKVEFDEKIGSGFVISPQDGSYRIGFTEDDFSALILYFLRPRVKKFLFGK